MYSRSTREGKVGEPEKKYVRSRSFISISMDVTPKKDEMKDDGEREYWALGVVNWVIIDIHVDLIWFPVSCQNRHDQNPWRMSAAFCPEASGEECKVAAGVDQPAAKQVVESEQWAEGRLPKGC